MTGSNSDEQMSRAALRVTVAVVLAFIVDGMDYQLLALVLPVLVKDLKITPVLAGLLVTFTVAGMGIGGIAGSWLADRIGRVRVIWWSVACFSVCTGAIAVSQTDWQIAALRFVSGFGIGAVYRIGNLLVSEYVPTRLRATALSCVIAGWSLGYIFAALITGSLLSTRGWRPMFMVAALPGVLCIPSQ